MIPRLSERLRDGRASELVSDRDPQPFAPVSSPRPSPRPRRRRFQPRMRSSSRKMRRSRSQDTGVPQRSWTSSRIETL
jgi:hypothetical protein